MCEYVSVFAFIQTSMSVRARRTITVMSMHSALTLKEVSAVPATLVILEMVSPAQVHIIVICTLCLWSLYALLHSFNMQISTSVNWSYIHVIPMPTALTQMAASTVHVAKALKEMGSHVQV